MTNVGKFIWGENEDNYLNGPFDSVQDCKDNIQWALPCLLEDGREYVFIGQITEEFDFKRAASDLAAMAENIACEYDTDASLSDEFVDKLAELLVDKFDIRNYHVRMVEKVKLEDLDEDKD